MRTLFGQLLAEIQRIKSEGDFEAARKLVEKYAVKIDPVLHAEILARYEKLHLAPYKGFVNPVYAVSYTHLVQGVDVMNAVCEKFGHKVSYEYAICGADAIDKVGDPFPEMTFQACKNADAVLFSAVGDPKFDNDPTAKVRPEQGLLAMRKKLGLFANIRPVQTFKCLVHKSPLRAELVENADFICIRELTGGMYFGEKYQDNDKAYDTNMYTRPEIERILKVAFEYAMKRRKHLTVVDKANVLASSRLWRQIAQEMAPQYPEVTTDYMFVDNAAMKMLQDPCFFDVMVTENTFGDILTDEGSVISGSMGLLPSASTGESTPVFEPIHGSWPQAQGLNIANPLAQILSCLLYTS